MIGDVIAALSWVLLGAVIYRTLAAQLRSERDTRHDARHLAEQEKGRRAMGRAAGGPDLSQTADHDPFYWDWDRGGRADG